MVGFIAVLVSAIFDGIIGFADVVLLLLWLWIGIYHSRKIWPTVVKTTAFLVLASFLEKDYLSERVTFLIAAVAFH
jgi:hypothetical protein